MRVAFQRTGGFAGITMQTTVDTVNLPEREANQLCQLVEVADFFNLPTSISSSYQPDRFQYKLTAEDNGKQHTVVVGESAIPGTLRPLIDWLMEATRKKF